MKQSRQPVHTAVDQFVRGYNVYAPLLIEQIEKNLAKDMSVQKAVRTAWDKTNGTKLLTDATMEGIVYSLEASSLSTVVKPVAFRKWWLNQDWVPGEKFSRTIWRTGVEMQVRIVEEIRNSMKNADSWTKLALNVDQAISPKADIAEHIKELIKKARIATNGDSKAVAGYRKALNVSIRQVDRLARGGAPTTRLKKAYQNIITATEKGKEEAISAAVNRAVSAKARYNAERLARTEYARAYGQGFNKRLDQDSDIEGWQWRLSSRHNIYDICNVHASIDIFGAGAGVYPKYAALNYPAHPHCTCQLSPVYIGEAHFGRPDMNQGAEWIKKQSAKSQKQLMGIAGQKSFSSNPNNWQNELNQWGGVHRRTPSTVPDRFLER
jgi:hypothetical protein